MLTIGGFSPTSPKVYTVSAWHALTLSGTLLLISPMRLVLFVFAMDVSQSLGKLLMMPLIFLTTDCLYVSNSICGRDTPCPHFLKGVDRGIRLQGELLPQPTGIGSNARDKQ